MPGWLKEPLLHFIVLGAVIFAVYGWSNGPQRAGNGEIVVSLRQQENLAATFSRAWQRPPTQTEMAALIGDFIRQEIAYREGLAMRLDRGDTIVRRRLRQKLERLTGEFATLAPPAAQELQQYLEQHPEDFRLPASLTLRQVYFATDDGHEQAQRRARELLAQLRLDPESVDVDAAGDRSLLPPELHEVRAPQLDALFGRGFAAAVLDLGVGDWSGPLRSGLGLHLVYVEDRVDGRMPRFDEVAGLVRREWLAARRKSALDSLYARLAAKYTIRIEAPPDLVAGP